ncbi:MAG TPA: hypothetical protein ENF48_03685 [Desulfobacteraceae bacterium]|nr:hypothetical protein [Deltaproteobacteria bacterium]RLB98164.1 MAG: hypothetical protein DRH76_03230 [Deltaproteobacteria bacterium]HDI59452.1 hypothetical protein [Desulfobacteraceae bacterium]
MHKRRLKTISLVFFAWLTALAWPGLARSAAPEDLPRGLTPAGDMAFMPKLAGLRNKTYHNQYGHEKSLSEAIVLRGSDIAEGRATVPAGGLFYISETSGDAAPLSRDPFLVLGEHAYLVDLATDQHRIQNFSVAQGEKKPVGDTGYRMWFDYATDHYEKPYAELALVAPSGGWPLEFPIASEFPDREAVLDLKTGEGHQPQLEKFYLDSEYLYGATRFKAAKVGFEEATFESITFPAITEATFAMSRPVALEVRQEDYRLYFDKRIYAFRRPDGFLVRVTDFWGRKVFGEKLIKPVTAQGYKTLMGEKDKYHLTLPEIDLRVEIIIHPSWMKHSDFVPWRVGKAHGFQHGKLEFVIYDDLLTVRHGEPWPLDERYTVILEPDLKTGMLKRLVLENAEALVFDNQHTRYKGPVKWSEVWNRPAFTVVADDFDGDVVRQLYVRDYYWMRTDNMVHWPADGRYNIDFFVGSSPVLEPILEHSFLTRLADPSLGTVVEESRFTSYPKVISDASFYEPDHTAPFVPRLKGLMRKLSRNRKGERLLSAESIFIRGSYVDYDNNRIVIPPAGLCYSSRNARNIRSLAGEKFFMLGKWAYLTSFESSTYVRKNVHLDAWKNRPMGDGNLMYWQDELLGVRNKALRFNKSFYLDDRPVAELSLMKYSGNRWGAHFFLAQGLDPQGGNRYRMPELFAEGATYIVPEYVGANYVKLKEFATPSIEAISFTYKKPKEVLLSPGGTVKLGGFTLRCTTVDAAARTVALQLLDEHGATVTEKVLGPLDAATIDLLPQYQEAARSVQLMYADVQAEMDVKNPFEDGKARLWLYTGIQRLERDTPFEFDARFVVHPDVCGHCYQFNEILLDNPEPIILDKANPVYEGPRGRDGKPLFRIVIDDFDGEMIHAWHIETEYRGKIEKTDNLAFRPRKNLDVLVGVTGTVEGFLRLSMLPRLGFMESWRTGAKAPATKLSGSVNTGGSAHIKR